ncbi:MAG: pyridoxal-phosphate dependent enzyme [Chryseolinea sp.]
MSSLHMLTYTTTPIQEIHDYRLRAAGVTLLVKREDLNHPTVSGNKWWKLKYNLVEVGRTGCTTLLTFGGAYSNHIYATAAAARELNYKSIGIIRGEEVVPRNTVLQFAKDHGMELHFVKRDEYRSKGSPEMLADLQDRFGAFYLIPEGGSNALALQGISEFGTLLGTDFDFLCCPIGTGATMAGLIQSFGGKKQILGFTVLKGDDWSSEIERYNPGYSNWTVIQDYHGGGYAKMPPALRLFTEEFTSQHFPIENVYSGKLFFGIFDLIYKGYFREGSKIMAIHTGGIHRPQAII